MCFVYPVLLVDQSLSWFPAKNIAIAVIAIAVSRNVRQKLDLGFRKYGGCGQLQPPASCIHPGGCEAMCSENGKSSRECKGGI